MKKILPWLCEGCQNKWVDNLYVTWADCPECGCEAVFHDKVREIQENDIWYRNDSD